MGRAMLRRSLVLAIIGGSVSFGSARAEKVEESGLVFSATLGRTVLLPMEPVVLDLFLENKGERTFVRSQLDPPAGLPVRVVTTAGEKVECLPTIYRFSEPNWSEMKPGDRFATRGVFVPVGLLRIGRLAPLLVAPGEYSVEVGCSVLDKTTDPGKALDLQLPPMKVRVDTPDERSAKAFQSWRQAVKESGYLLEGTASDTEASLALRGIYGDTIYGLYARHYAALVPDRELQRDDVLAHYAAAAEAIEDFLPVALQTKFPLADELLVALADDYSLLGKGEEAGEAVEELKRRFPDSPAVYRLQDLVALPDALRPFGPRPLAPEQLPDAQEGAAQ